MTFAPSHEPGTLKLIQCGYNFTYRFNAPTPVVLMLHLRPELIPRVRAAEKFLIHPAVPFESFLDAFGNRCVRLTAPSGRVDLCGEVLVEDTGRPAPIAENARQQPVADLPTAVLSFLRPSRYCEVDLMGELAWRLFGYVTPGWARVQAVCDWVHGLVRFDYGFASATRTARQTWEQRVGVCRDFTHLAVTICRCLNIPARYVTGYLGDIGVPPDPAPMDFSACMQVYLGGEWHTFDVRHNARRIGYIEVAHGHDAADVALTTSFGHHCLERFIVRTHEVSAASMGAQEPVSSRAAENREESDQIRIGGAMDSDPSAAQHGNFMAI
jgi:transglutaminase-like putative cysteine protease